MEKQMQNGIYIAMMTNFILQGNMGNFYSCQISIIWTLL